MFLYLILFITSLVVLSKDTPGTSRTFKFGKAKWTLISDKETWSTSDEVDWTIFYKATTSSVEYADEVWCLKVNGKIQWKRLSETCKRQVKELKTNFADILLQMFLHKTK